MPWGVEWVRRRGVVVVEVEVRCVGCFDGCTSARVRCSRMQQDASGVCVRLVTKGDASGRDEGRIRRRTQRAATSFQRRAWASSSEAEIEGGGDSRAREGRLRLRLADNAVSMDTAWVVLVKRRTDGRSSGAGVKCGQCGQSVLCSAETLDEFG
jgi:hypothetical protein